MTGSTGTQTTPTTVTTGSTGTVKIPTTEPKTPTAGIPVTGSPDGNYPLGILSPGDSRSWPGYNGHP